MGHDTYDITITTEQLSKTEAFQVYLVDAIANGRLFLLNGAGEFEKVVLATYWKDDNILTVCDGGYEFNEDGSVTRDWRK